MAGRTRGFVSRLLWVSALACTVQAGDPEVAGFFAAKAEKALRARDYAAAASDYQRAREEMTPFPEAAYGLGTALEKLDREAEAIAAYRACIAEVEAADGPSIAQKGFARRAGSAIKRLRKRFADLDKLNQDVIRRCLEFARGKAKSDPRWAISAYEIVLRLDPTHVEAKQALERLAKAAPAPAAPPEPGESPKRGPRGRVLIRDNGLEGWSPGVKGPWSCADGIVTCDGVERNGHLNWIDDVEFSGKYELRARVRLVEPRGDRRALGIFLGDGKNEWYGIILESDNEVALVRYEDGETRDVTNGIPRGFDPSKWHTWRVAVDGENLEFFLEDRKILEYRAMDPIAGKVALFVQRAKVEFKEIEVRP